MRHSDNYIFLIWILFTGLLTACASQPGEVVRVAHVTQSASTLVKTPAGEPAASLAPTLVEFSLETQVKDGKMVFVGLGGKIDGLVNPDLVVPPGATVLVTLVNGDGIMHDLSFPDFKAKTAMVSARGQSAAVSFAVAGDQTGTYPYYCTQPGHRQAGQEGKLVVGEP